MSSEQVMLKGDCVAIMRDMWGGGEFDAVIADPPYATGGRSSASRARAPRCKYQSSSCKRYYPTFENDNRDQRSHLMWMVRWMEEALRVTRPGGWLMCFTDWRQLPLTSDAAQIAGWIWRGVVPWDKTEKCRPVVGMFRNQVEYVIVATKGARNKEVRGCPAGAVRVPIYSKDKLHMTGKPVALMEHLMSVLPEGARVLDPFAGSGTTLVAARNRGYDAVGVELSEDYFRIACERLGQGL